MKVEKLHAYLEKYISPLYLVGGCVRDELMYKEPNDIDFTTPHSPEKIIESFKGVHKTFKEGKKFGTIGLIVDGEKVEITTFRNERYLSGSRKPQVEYVSDINTDLSRRDFTINAIAKRHGKIIDPFGGRTDIQNGTIRCVSGEPHARFKEDALRMLRACRFSSKLGFVIDIQTANAIRTNSHKILEISRERWSDEMDKLLMCDHPGIGLNYMMETYLMNWMFPEISTQWKYNQKSPYHELNLWEHTLSVIENVEADIVKRWSAFFHDGGKYFVRIWKDNPDRYVYAKHEILSAEIADKYGRYLKWSNKRRTAVVDMVRNHMEEDSPLKKADDYSKSKILN